jgi:hypothetical protein
MRHEVEPTFPVETEPPAAGASPNSEQDATRRRHVRVRLRLHAVWEAARCTLDAEPALLTAPREAVLELVDRPGAVELGGRYLDDSSQTPQVRFPLPAGDPDAFWRQVWDCALAAVAGRLAAEIDPGRREQPEAGSSPIGEPLRDEVIDVYLPFLKRSERAWPRPDQNADAFELEVDGFHGVRVLLTEGLAARWERENFRQAALLLAEALPRPAHPAQPRPALRFADGRRLTPSQLRHSFPRLLAACGYEVPEALCTFMDGDIGPAVDVAIELSLPSAEVRPWLEAPRQRSPEFYEAFGRVSRAIQQALRAWLPYMFFSDLDRYGDAEAAYPMLAYQACRPFCRKSSPEFTYDVMNPESVQRALRSASVPLGELLQSASALLAESGREELARRYRKLDPKTVLENVKRAPRAFQSLLAAEASFVGEVIKLALEARSLREEPAEAPRRLHRLISQFTEALHQRLRRIYRGLAPVSLGSLVLIEANRALSLAHGFGAPLEAVIRLRTGAGIEAAYRLLSHGATERGADIGPV